MPKTLDDFVDLTEPQRTLLTQLERNEKFTKIFYFTGGTLLKALGIVPRESNDLDFFTFPEVDGHTYTAALTHVRSILDDLFDQANVKPTERGFLLTEEGTRIECVYDIVQNIDEFSSFGNLKISSLQDLAANKSAAFCVRDELKDYIDLAFLTRKQGWLLADLATLSEKRFRMGTISEAKLLTEILSKRDMFSVDPKNFLRNGEKNVQIVEEQMQYLLDHTSL